MERPEQQSIASRKPEIAFYAGADWVEITGRETPEQILKIMKEKHTGYLALDTRELGDVVQRFVDAKEKSATQEFTLIKEFEYGMERVNLYLLRD